MFVIFDLFISSHPDILISLGSCALACILASWHSHILMFVCTCLYPHVLTSSYLQFICPCLHPCILISSGLLVLACILTSSHPYILRFICVSLYICIFASSYPQVHVCLLVSLHPHSPYILRFMCVCLYTCILTSSYPQVHVRLLVSSHPHILVSSGLSVFASMLTSSCQCVLDTNE